MTSLIPPGLLLLLGAVVVPLLGRVGRQVLALVLPRLLIVPLLALFRVHHKLTQ